MNVVFIFINTYFLYMSNINFSLSNRNRKVAINRWSKVNSLKKAFIEVTSKNKLSYSIMLGFLAGDGSVQKRKIKSGYRYQIDFFPDDKYMLDIFLYCFYDLYYCYPSLKKKVNFYSVRVSSNVIGEYLLNKCNLGTKDWDIPKDINHVLWLKAFFSCEAYVSKYIRLQTINGGGMKKISDLLFKFSIDHKFYTYKPKNGNSLVYIIVIIRKKALKLFYTKIGFFHDKKTLKLKEALYL